MSITWIALTAAAMFALAVGNAGRAPGNPALRTEDRVTLIDRSSPLPSRSA